MSDPEIIDWLLQGDPSIRFQAERDLLGRENPALRERIAIEGWGARFLKERNKDKHWGMGFYQPKWTSSHYTLIDLRRLELPSDNPLIRESIRKIAHEEKGIDGGINPSGTIAASDVCINGMFLDYASFFRMDENQLKSVVDFILSQIMPDGGFNCRLNRSGARHSSMHSTICVLEGITEYLKNGYTHRKEELARAGQAAEEFLLMHRLFLSDRTGNVINPSFLRLSWPSRWKYDILRSLDYFRYAGKPFDERMRPAMLQLLKKRGKDGRWPLQSKHPGKVHFEMEKPGEPGRWNTLRVLRVLRAYSAAAFSEYAALPAPPQ
jgi:hypothetical protein